jgi:hypothetical protein
LFLAKVLLHNPNIILDICLVSLSSVDSKLEIQIYNPLLSPSFFDKLVMLISMTLTSSVALGSGQEPHWLIVFSSSLKIMCIMSQEIPGHWELSWESTDLLTLVNAVLSYRTMKHSKSNMDPSADNHNFGP